MADTILQPPSKVPESAANIIPWERVDTVLVDMDGTLLDLAFDNEFWLDTVPAHYARVHGVEAKDARAELRRRYNAIEGSLDWYCIDHWTRELNLDIRSLKRTQLHLIRYLPRATEFLRWLRDRGKRVLLVTNAHPFTLEVKLARTGLAEHVDWMISSHQLDTPKETNDFWERLQTAQPFDPERTLLIEDSLTVLEAAVAFGVAMPLAIRSPDSRYPPRRIEGFPSVDGVYQLLGRDTNTTRTPQSAT